MLSVLAIGFVVLAIGLALGRGESFEVSRARLGERFPALALVIAAVLVLFFGLSLASGHASWPSALFALVFGLGFVALVGWFVRR